MNRRAVASLAFVLIPPFLPLLEAAEVPLQNPRFEAWEGEDKPAGWRVGLVPDYRVSRDCEAAASGRCVIRLESLPEATRSFIPLAQMVGIEQLGGHLAKLSGQIRTRDVEDGWAGLWMRVDGHGKMLRLENMFKFGPRGTTDWQRFEISLPVAPNAKGVALGVLLSGRGTAWFDDLKLEVDRSVKVAKSEDAELRIPPRPKQSPLLLADPELALEAAAMAKVEAEWRDDITARHQAIRSLFSEDFSDLQFLKPLLRGKRVVQLGESGHGVAEFNWLKVRLIKFLHREMGFDVVAFESSLSGCNVADAKVGTSPPRDVMRDCIFQVWHTAETLGLFEYLDAERKAGRRISLAGFDTQNSGAASKEVARRLVAMAQKVDPELAKAIERHEARAYQLSAEDSAAMAQSYRTLAELLRKERDASIEVELAVQECLSRVRYVQQRAPLPADMRAHTRVRDEGMADNLDFLLDRMYPGRKVIVWAHNTHISKRHEDAKEPYAMGQFVAARREAEVYTIGLYMGRGVATLNNRQPYAIHAPADHSLEALLANAGRKMSFVDFSAAREPQPRWMFEPIVVREWGTRTRRLVAGKTYDAVIYIDTVTPPAYH